MSLFPQSKALTPQDLLNSAINNLASKQATAPTRKGVARTEPVADAVQKDEARPEAKTEVKPEANPDVQTVTGVAAKVDPLAARARGSIFKRPVNVSTSSAADAAVGESATQPQANEVAAPSAAIVEERAVVQASDSTEAKVETKAAEHKAEVESVAKNEKPKRTLASVKKETEKRVEEAVDFKILLNTFRVYGPLMAAVTYNPGRGKPAEDTSEATRLMMRETEKLTRHMCSISDVDFMDPDRQWIVSSFRAIASEHISNEWKRNPNPETFSADPYLEAFAELSRIAAVEADKHEFPDMTESVRISLSMMKSVLPVIREYSLFENVLASMAPGFKVNREAIFDNAANLIQSKAQEALEAFNFNIDGPSRTIVYQGLLGHAGSIMSNAIASAGDRMLDKLDQMNAEERNRFIREQIANGNSIIISNRAVEDEFNRSFDALLTVVRRSIEKFAMKAPVAANMSAQKQGMRAPR